MKLLFLSRPGEFGIVDGSAVRESSALEFRVFESTVCYCYQLAGVSCERDDASGGNWLGRFVIVTGLENLFIV